MSPLPNPNLALDKQDPLTLLAMCVWAEARGEVNAARQGVASVVRNRVGYQGKYGEKFAGVILKPYQFSSFNVGDPNREKMLCPLENQGALAEKVWDDCYSIAQGIYIGTLADNTEGAVFYFSPPLTQPPLHGESLAWGPTFQTVKLGALTFHRDKPRPSVEYDKVLHGTQWYFVPRGATI